MAEGSSKGASAAGWKDLKFQLSNGSTATVTVESHVYHSIVHEKDQDVLQCVIKGYKEIYGGDQTLAMVATNNATEPETGTEEYACQQLEEPASQASPSVDQGTHESTMWSYEAVMLLIALYKEHKEKFNSPAYRQKDVWKTLADKMIEHGHTVNGSECHEKFRSLKYRHRLIRDANMKSGRVRRNWQFFDSMEKLLAEESAVQPVKVVALAETLKATKPLTRTEEYACQRLEEHACQASQSDDQSTHESLVWSYEAVLLLISLYGEHKEKFNSPVYRQKDVWKSIADKMIEQGHTVSGIQCDDKFRSLKHRHRLIRDANEKGGRGRRSWQFFAAMEAVQPVKVVALTETLKAAEPETVTEEYVRQELEESRFQASPSFDQSAHESTIWSYEAVMLLIALYGEHKEKFNSPVHRQKDVWKTIADKMIEQGHIVSGIQCNEKFRSLKHRHRVIRDSNEKSGRVRRSWQFFGAMEKLFAEDPVVQPVKVVALSEILRDSGESKTNTNGKLPGRTQSPTRSSTPTAAEELPVVKRRRKGGDAPEWFRTFMEESNRRMDALEESSRRMLEVSERRNTILNRLADALVKN